MAKDLYRQLQERLDLFSMGFPTTESGIEIKILKYLFNEKDAELFLSLSHNLETPEQVSERINQSSDIISEQLEKMAKSGLLFRLKKNDISRYGAIPFVHGLFEFQVKSLQPELARMVGDYYEEAFDTAMQNNADYFLRVVPVNQSVDVTHNVANYEDAVEILQSKGSIVVTDCICRKRTEVIDEGCGKTMEACFMFGSMGQYYLDNNMGRSISTEEAITILEKCREEGLVTQPATSQNPAGMCNCCGDCCGVLGAIKKHPAPSEMVFSNHLVQTDTEACTGCELCLERCQMDALKLNGNELIEVEIKRCIGCGLCVTTCPTEALSLIEKPGSDLRIPPETMVDQMMQMAKNRGIL